MRGCPLPRPGAGRRGRAYAERCPSWRWGGLGFSSCSRHWNPIHRSALIPYRIDDSTSKHAQPSNRFLYTFSPSNREFPPDPLARPHPRRSPHVGGRGHATCAAGQAAAGGACSAVQCSCIVLILALPICLISSFKRLSQVGERREIVQFNTQHRYTDTQNKVRTINCPRLCPFPPPRPSSCPPPPPPSPPGRPRAPRATRSPRRPRRIGWVRG